jgi:hypothetical protein
MRGTHFLLTIGEKEVRTPRELREQGTLTNCQVQRKGQVRTLRQGIKAGVIHSLLATEGGISQGYQKNIRG